MPSPTEITVAQLSRLVGLPNAPVLIDVRGAHEYQADPRLLPTAQHQDPGDVANWSGRYPGRSIVVLCQRRGPPSHAVVAWLRHAGADAQALEGGYEAWCDNRQPLVRAEKIPPRDSEGRTVWVTRARPKVVRIACPWLIRRFNDPRAVFLFVPPVEVAGVADHALATPFDVDGAARSDRNAKTTFDVMLEEFGLATPPLSRLAAIVRGADTGKVELTQQLTLLPLARMRGDGNSLHLVGNCLLPGPGCAECNTQRMFTELGKQVGGDPKLIRGARFTW